MTRRRPMLFNNQWFGVLAMDQRRWNWHLWTGFVVCLTALVSYFFVFARFPATRDVPWVNFLLFGTGIAFLFFGLKHAFGDPQQYRGKIAGPILSLLGLCIVGVFCFLIFYQTRQLPPSAGAPRVGQKALDFVLPDTNNRPVSLSSLLSTPLANAPPKAVLLVFYRGYW
jgi:hypothetical protein